jgi:hypothetical protein
MVLTEWGAMCRRCRPGREIAVARGADPAVGGYRVPKVTGVPTLTGRRWAGSGSGALLMTWFPAADVSAGRRVRGLP